MRILLLVVTLFLAACASTQNMSVYSFTNSEVEGLLAKQLPKMSDKVSVMGLPLKLDVNDISVNIGPDNSDVVVLGADTSAQIKAFALKYPIRLKLQIQGRPYYDSKEKAVFLKDVKLLDSTLNAGKFKGNLGSLDQQAMEVINSFLSKNPVYRLNTSDPKVMLLSKLPLDMKISQGVIKLVPHL